MSTEEHIPMTRSPMGETRTEFVCRPQRAAEAREAVASFLLRLSPAPAAHTLQNLLLLVSELVTNALRHAGGVTALWLKVDRSGVHISVTDPSSVHPQPRTPDLTGRTGGFGWLMVRRLAPGVSVRDRSGGGKVITASVPH